jgi:hypothetical protein
MNSNLITRYEDKPMYKDKEYLLVLLFFLLLVGLIVYTIYVEINSINLKPETSFNGRVTNTSNQKSTYYLKLSDKEKWFRLRDIRNEEYPELGFDFMDIIEKGDSIFKKVNSDTIVLIRPERAYYFKIEKYID